MKAPSTQTQAYGGLTVVTVPARFDNYMYLLLWGDRAAVVDPGEEQPVLDFLQQQGLTLELILNTHHHGDHVSGNQALKRICACEVIGPKDHRIPGLDRPVGEGDRVEVGPARLEVLETPGHGKSDLSFFLKAAPDEAHGAVWTGDTMFVGGCGRLFECGPSTMWTSLQKLSALPGNTHVYCGHEYTMENYEFAATIAPDDNEVRNRRLEVEGQLQKGEFTVPSTMAKEAKTNLFLRAGEPAVRRALGVPSGSAVEAFAELRRRKDVF